jgi:hypothetical protein
MLLGCRFLINRATPIELPFLIPAALLSQNIKNTRVFFDFIINSFAIFFKLKVECLVLREVKAFR